jgi:hypothetical protein
MMNQGTIAAKNDWLLLFGVAETLAESYTDIPAKLSQSANNCIFRCCHENDPNQWKRIWNRTSNSRWSGLIHEEIIGGVDGGLLFRMQDTDKTPMADPLKQEVFRYIKTLSYNAMYHRLLHNPNQLAGTNSGWLQFVAGARESIEAFVEGHKDMLLACMDGDFPKLLGLVSDKLEAGNLAAGVKFTPVGT